MWFPSHCGYYNLNQVVWIGKIRNYSSCSVKDSDNKMSLYKNGKTFAFVTAESKEEKNISVYGGFDTKDEVDAALERFERLHQKIISHIESQLI